MKKTGGLILIVTAFLLSCSGNAKKEEATIETYADTTIVANDVHTAKNSLDYEGTYKGVLPCADCDSIVTIITLGTNDYVKTSSSYKNKKETKLENKGSYTWNDKENTIILDGIKDSPNRYFVGENFLKQLDMNGNEITGELADKYILRK